MTIPLFDVSSDPIPIRESFLDCTHKDDTNVRYPLFSFFGSQYSCGDIRTLRVTSVVDVGGPKGGSGNAVSDKLAEIKLGMEAAAPTKFNCYNKLTLFFSLLFYVFFSNGPLFYRVCPSNISSAYCR